MPILALLLSAIALVVASGLEAAPRGTASQPQAIPFIQADADAATLDLKGSVWLLKSLGGEDVDPAIGSSLEFDTEGNVFGSGGCNRFRGSAAIDGGTLKFGELASTMMACQEPNSKQEAAYLAALAETAAYAFEDENLVLLNGAGDPVARFSRAQ